MGVPWGFDGAHGTDVRPPHVGAGKQWAKNPSTPGVNDGTRLTASIVNRLIGNILALAQAYGVSLTEDGDDDLKACIVAAIQNVQPASHDHDGRYYTQDQIDALVAALVPIAAIVDDLTTGGTDVPLSAEAGKILNDRINGMGDPQVVADLSAAAALTGLDAGDIVHVLDNGSGKWVRYQITAAGDGTWAGATKIVYWTQDQAPASHGHPAADITDSSASGRALLTAADSAAIRTLLTVYTTTQVDAAIAAALVLPRPPEGRLTLQSGVPAGGGVAATTIYYTPTVGRRVPIYDGAIWTLALFSELALALDSDSGHTGYHAGNTNFDVFVVNDGGTIRLVTGPAWSSATDRGTGPGTTELELFEGLLVNKQTITGRFGSGSGDTVSVAARRATYLGTACTVAAGQVDDSSSKRFLWNAYNRVSRQMRALDSTDSWTYSTGSWRQARASSANQLDFVIGWHTDAVEATVQGVAQNSTSTLRQVAVGIGVDSVAAPVAGSQMIALDGAGAGNAYGLPRAHYVGYAGIGRHYLAWLEIGAGSDTQTWYGDNGSSVVQTGIVGMMRG